jgi:hypothetical protein
MIGFSLVLGHLVGDYLFQNDWQAKYKVARRPHYPRPGFGFEDMAGIEAAKAAWDAGDRAGRIGPWACTVHCLLYTLAVFLCTWPVHLFPWWFYLGVGLVHWPVDRFRLARVWMTRVSGQEAFATGPLAPWSVIVVDNTFHLLTLYLLALLVL